jgi:hypothetical protein
MELCENENIDKIIETLKGLDIRMHEDVRFYEM